MRRAPGNYSLRGFDQLQCIFVHVPKTGGVSINTALFGNYGGGHTRIGEYKKIFGPRTFNRYFKFSFVRNPFSRLLSAYLFLQNGGFGERDQAWAYSNIQHLRSFEEFIRGWLDEEKIWTKYHFVPQYAYLCDIDVMPEVDFIGRYESIQDDFAQICHRLDMHVDLPRENIGPADTSAWEAFYTPALREKVFALYQRDFELFGYDR